MRKCLLYAWYPWVLSQIVNIIQSLHHVQCQVHLALQTRDNDQKRLISPIDERQNVKQLSIVIKTVSLCNIKSTQVTICDEMAENGLFRILAAVKMRKKICSKNFFELKFSGKVESVKRNLHMQFENI